MSEYPPILESAREWTEGVHEYRIEYDEISGCWLLYKMSRWSGGGQWHVSHPLEKLFVACFWVCAWEREVISIRKAWKRNIADEKRLSKQQIHDAGRKYLREVSIAD